VSANDIEWTNKIAIRNPPDIHGEGAAWDKKRALNEQIIEFHESQP